MGGFSTVYQPILLLQICLTFFFIIADYPVNELGFFVGFLFSFFKLFPKSSPGLQPYLFG